MREDYRRIMSHTVTTDDFTAIAETVKNYLLNESAIRAVFSEGTTEEYISDMLVMISRNSVSCFIVFNILFKFWG